MTTKNCSRRTFLKTGLHGAAGFALAASGAPTLARWGLPMKKFDISLAAWSVHRMVNDGRLTQIDMPELCRKQFDIGGLELVNSFFPSPQYSYCQALLKRAADNGVKILLIMCDGEGDMAHADKAERQQAVRNHRKWLDIAAVLGCHSIRCNAGDAKPGDADAISRCAESFAALVELARPDKLNVLIENHGGMSSDPDSLLAVVQKVNDPLLGTLPDFGNFPPKVDRYDAVRRMMPYAKAVSAKCHEFDETGNEKTTDFTRMIPIVLKSGYNRYIGIEYEGPDPDEIAGVKVCQRLLERFQ
jgi:L-ribulose-5-phosphate 3-epimerase